jgi:dTDP-4-amino-4,6-dideoxygalactose transaminase/CelD/BcsL family acetyltransferase involved in cellulose biosynthesis
MIAGRYRGKLPFPIDRQDTLATYVARGAIYHLIRALDLKPGETILVPNYHHGNEVRAIRAAGARVRFYPIKRDLSPDLDALRTLCTPDCRVLFTIHYLGWPQPLDELIRLCCERDLILIEDCALAFLSKHNGRPLGSFGDYSIFCLYKTVPVPNGGILAHGGKAGERLGVLGRIEMDSPSWASLSARTADLLLGWWQSRFERTGRFARAAKSSMGDVMSSMKVKRAPVGDGGFDPVIARLGMSSLSRHLLERFEYESIRAARRASYARLDERLRGRGPLLELTLGEDVCPLFYPILVTDKDAASARLSSSGIETVQFWNEGDPEATDPSGDVEHLRRHVLELPIHQDVSAEQIEMIADRVMDLPEWTELDVQRSRKSRVSLKAEVIRDRPDARLTEEWEALCDEGPCADPFYRPRWIAAHHQAFDHEKPLITVTLRRDGRLRAVLPLVKESASLMGLPFSRLRGAANVHSCRFDLIHGLDGVAEIAPAMWTALCGLEWDMLFMTDVPEDGAFRRLAAMAESDGWPTGWWESMQTPFIPIADFSDVDALLGGRDGHFRSNLRRRWRKLGAKGDVCFRRIDRYDPQMLEAFYRLEESGWKGEEHSAIACRPETRSFYESMVHLASERGWLSMYALELNGLPIAIQLGLAAHGRYSIPKVAYDESFGDCSPGHLLMERVLGDCLERGMRELDFLGPSMQWKSDWTAHRRSFGFAYVFRDSAYGRTLHSLKFGTGKKLARVLKEALSRSRPARA